MNIAVFPGSFDPPTYGHLNIIERVSTIFERVDVVVAVNANKSYLFSAEERFAMMKKLVEPYKNVRVVLFDSLIVNYAKKVGAKVLIRGIRNANDFAYEFDLAMMNHSLNSEIETLFIPSVQRYAIVKSSSIKELAQFGGDISEMVPPLIEEALGKKYHN
jgi:pantetheine-phosphate adenylyltransferase